MNRRDKAIGYLALGVCLVAIGLFDVAQPTSGRPTGRWSFLLGPLFDVFGLVGPGMFSVAVGLVFGVAGLLLWRKK